MTKRRIMICLAVLTAAILTLCGCVAPSPAEPTSVPEVTKAPETTAAPEATAVPEVTEAPEETAVPDETEAPETGPKITVTDTGIKADSVSITGGYGSVKLNIGNEDGTSTRKIALMDSSGSIVFDWKETNRSYYVSDGIVTLTAGKNGSASVEAPEYFTLDGAKAFDRQDIYSGDPMLNGYAAVFLKDEDGSMVIVDKTGTTVFEFPGSFSLSEMCDEAGWYSEGLIAWFNYIPEPEGEKWSANEHYYIDISGAHQIEFYIGSPNGFYDNLYPFYYGFARVYVYELGEGFIDKTGKPVIPCEYEAAKNCTGDLFPVKKDGKWGYVNSKNETVIPFEYDNVYGGQGGFATAVKDGKCGIVNYANETVVPFEYDDISGIENGVAYAIKDGTVYVISIN